MNIIINYKIGDATQPTQKGNKIICHICNDVGGWGAGFVLAISARWKEPEQVYRALKPKERVLGYVQFIEVADDLIVANMIAQHDVKSDENGLSPIRYEALKVCMEEVNEMAKLINASLHMPRIGCGLAGGSWEKVSKVIYDTVSVPVTVYDFK